MSPRGTHPPVSRPAGATDFNDSLNRFGAIADAFRPHLEAG